MDVVVVESPTKAKTINKYLGRDFKVLASFGHVRDLPPKDGSVRPEEDFAMDWEADDRGERQVKEIAQALKGARRLFLATDPDHQRKGLASAVIAPVLERADREGLGAFLETGAEENLGFYARAGFEVTDEVVLPDGPDADIRVTGLPPTRYDPPVL